MHTRRIATFLLGAWIGGSLLMAFIQIQNLRSSDLVMSAPAEPVTKMIQTLGPEQVHLLLRHLAAQQTRHVTFLWEEMQIPLALVLGLLLVRATQSRILPLSLCGTMVAFALFQHFAINAELTYWGRETDFPPGNAVVGSVERVWALQQVYIGAEVVKLIAGGVLASYLFAFSTPRRSRKRDDTIDHTLHGHINR